jgi:hypothetical protein
MKRFIKITVREGEAIIRKWILAEGVIEISQNSITEQGRNEGTLVFDNGAFKSEEIKIINFNETIDSLN